MKIETKRLILRPPKKSDWKDIVEGLSEINVSKPSGNISYPYNKKNALRWISRCNKSWKKKNKEYYPFVIELKSKKKVIGNTSISYKNKQNKVANTGSWINKKYWRNGYFTEAKIPMLDYVFNKLKVRKVEIEVFSNNKASNIACKKLGFKLEGTKRKSSISMATGKIFDDNIYGILKEEWKKIRPKLIKKLKKK